MNIEKAPIEKSEIKLTIEMSADEMLPFIEKAARQISEGMDVPGFRKGQAPVDVVKQKVGEMTVLQEAAQLAIQATLPEAIKKEKLDTVGQPSINVEKLAPDNPMVFTVILPLLPEVKVGDISKIDAKKESVEVTGPEIDKVIDNLRRMRASEALVEREAKTGDKVEVKFEVFLDKIPIEGGSNEKYPMILGAKSMIPGFEDNIEGMKKDEEKDFALIFPQDYYNKQLAGKNCDFKVKLIAVYEITRPELNDDFAKMLGEFDSVDALKDAVEKNIYEEKQQRVDARFEQGVIDQLLSLSTFGDIPGVMVNQETQGMIGELEQNVARQGMDFDGYLKQLKKDRKQLMLDLAPDAVKRIKSALVIRAYAKQEAVEATEEEIKEETDKMRHRHEANPQVMQQIETPAYKEYLGNMIRNRKAFHQIMETVRGS